MAVTEIDIDAPPERVFAVLSDWRAYPGWVVGAKAVRGADPGFPAAGTSFYPQIGAGPLRHNARTRVLEVDKPRRIVIHAQAPPLGTAINALDLEPLDGGGRTHVTFREDPGDPLTAFVFTPLTHLLMRGRNDEALRRLKRLAEEHPELGRDVDVPAGKVAKE